MAISDTTHDRHRHSRYPLTRDAIIWLVGAVLTEQNDERTEQYRYMGTEIFAGCRKAAQGQGTVKGREQLRIMLLMSLI
jgi:hypothetical protein